MTYDAWKNQHAMDKATIIKINNFTTVDEIVEYFKFDNMVKNEPNFCPLYKDNIKCHDMEDLNCYYCGCPYFKVNENPKTVGKITIASTCIINSKYADTFYENPDDNNVVKIHCDCSNCTFIHTDSYVAKSLSNNFDSFLDYLRFKQLHK